ncbi:conserved hypothetical protein [Neospora caninum Liverpool]|uniref:Uncharacterized protein n=1 Tax=Neospora caninum (strain Liverpool) TaxID=572307 RepID=F0V9M9_NEOCL|nr:conserved hypothetical protein [Neospora caninum Liverpool]CBZ50455.1 conserved hypothetical protein [Neospora caninum Liverpool]CEL65064.1 TPA: hypothetical protein BN1204_009240 [Neospora caninum Liverpool]|eukprot:XP_003880488.1 conserved hypothetical protein [Neospora caninum Liverpool]
MPSCTAGASGSREEASDLVYRCDVTEAVSDAQTPRVSTLAGVPPEAAVVNASCAEIVWNGLSQVARDFPPSLPDSPEFSLSSLVSGWSPVHTESSTALLSAGCPPETLSQAVRETIEHLTVCAPSQCVSSSSPHVYARCQSFSKSGTHASQHSTPGSGEGKSACNSPFPGAPPAHHVVATPCRGRRRDDAERLRAESNPDDVHKTGFECFRGGDVENPLSCGSRASPYSFSSTSLSGLRHLGRLDELRRQAEAATFSQIKRIASRLECVEHVTWLKGRSQRGADAQSLESGDEGGETNQAPFESSQHSSTRFADETSGVRLAFLSGCSSGDASADEATPLQSLREAERGVREDLPEGRRGRQKKAEDFASLSASGGGRLANFPSQPNRSNGHERGLRNPGASVSEHETAKEGGRGSDRFCGASEEQRRPTLHSGVPLRAEKCASVKTHPGPRQTSSSHPQVTVPERLEARRTPASSHRTSKGGFSCSCGPESDVQARFACAAQLLMRRGIAPAVLQSETEASWAPSLLSERALELAELMPQVRSEATPLWALWWYCGRHAAAAVRSGPGGRGVPADEASSDSCCGETRTYTTMNRKSRTLSIGQALTELPQPRVSEPAAHGQDEKIHRTKSGETRAPCGREDGYAGRGWAQGDIDPPLDTSCDNRWSTLEDEMDDDGPDRGTTDKEGTREPHRSTRCGPDRADGQTPRLKDGDIHSKSETSDCGAHRSREKVHGHTEEARGPELLPVEQTSEDQLHVPSLRCVSESCSGTGTVGSRMASESNAEGTLSTVAVHSAVGASRDLLPTEGRCSLSTDSVVGVSPRRGEGTHLLDHLSTPSRPVFIDLCTPQSSPRPHARFLRGSTPVSRVSTPVQRQVGSRDALPPGELEPAGGPTARCEFIAASPSSEPSRAQPRRKRAQARFTPCYPPLDLVTVPHPEPGSAPRKRQSCRAGGPVAKA